MHIFVHHSTLWGEFELTVLPGQLAKISHFALFFKWMFIIGPNYKFWIVSLQYYKTDISFTFILFLSLLPSFIKLYLEKNSDIQKSRNIFWRTLFKQLKRNKS